MTFEDYWNEWCIASNCEEGECRNHFEAGAQSRQAEIDELQIKYDAMYQAFTVADECRKEWHRCYIGVRKREDELQKRIDEALHKLDGFNCPPEYGIDEIFNVIDLLKGNQNGATP